MRQIEPIQLETEAVYSTALFSLRRDKVRLPSGKETTFHVIDLKEACSVVAINDRNQVLLINQYRYPIQRYLWEIPAGLRDPGETAEQAALRELREEGNLSAAKIRPLISEYFQLCSIANPMMSIFLAEAVAPVEAEADESEIIRERRWFEIEDARSMVLSGEIKNAFTCLGILLACEVLKVGRAP